MAFERLVKSFRRDTAYHLLKQSRLSGADRVGLPTDEKYASIHDEADRNEGVRTGDNRKRERTPWLYAANVVLFLVLSGMLVRQALPWPYDNNSKLQATSFFSPMFSRYPIDLVSKVVIGPLFNEDTLSSKDKTLRAYPSKQVDAAWKELTEVGVITISRDEVVRLGKDPEMVVKAHESLGFGSDVYLAQIDGQHALHCLNAVRRYAYREYYYPHINSSNSAPGTSPFGGFDQAHLSHCLHILLQTLTCNPSFDLITHKWVESQDFPFPDFAINKQCVDHSQLLDWENRNRISTEQWVQMADYGPGPGETVFPTTDKFRAWSESEDAKLAGGHVHV